ncbi:MAG TPA: hypothetical protein VGP68_18115 [Gemmataceae bacterium]|nr:hypothetical protein [Gemmataceae bacterium]
MRRMIFALPLLAGLAWTSVSRAGIDADPNKDYPLTPQAGQYLICATCFVGPQAPKLAREMVYEIRSHFGVPAYVFDKGEEERLKERERLRKQHEEMGDNNVPLKTIRIPDECAVLVGGFKDFESASKALKIVKNWPPPQKKELMPVIADASVPENENEAVKIRGAYISPYVQAFVARNTTIPLEKKADPKMEAFMRKINAHEKYSVYDCRKPWTLVVAQFQGVSVVQSKAADESFINKLLDSSKGKSLSASAMNADNMCEFLRKSKIDAYVLHTTWGSVVCVGGFDSRDDPKMGMMKARLSAFPKGQGLQLMPEPLPMEVPKG